MAEGQGNHFSRADCNLASEGYILSKRIVGYDVARALAVFGMVVVNFKVVMGAGGNGPAYLAGLAGLIDGRAAATFVILAGVGLSLISREGRILNDRKVLARDRVTLLKRAIFLFIVGSVFTPIWPADILHFYGVYIAVAAFLLSTPTRRLFIFAFMLVFTFVLMLLIFDYEKGWDWNTLAYEGLWTPGGTIRHLFFNGFHPVIPWLAFLLFGMILGRLDVNSPTVRRGIFLWGAGCAIAAELTSRRLIALLLPLAGPEEKEVIVALFGTEPMPPTPLYMIAAAGTACALIAACLELGERFRDSRWIRALETTGQLALTLYVAHVVLGMGFLQVLGRLENQTLGFAIVSALSFSIVGIMFADRWRIRFKRGPLEAVMRGLTDPTENSP